MGMPLGHRTSLEERFQRKAVRQPNGCLFWGSKLYPTFSIINADGSRSFLRVSHYVWEKMNGPLPEGHGVLHHCDDGRCVEETHLFSGTPKDNTQDMISKGRAKLGMRKIDEAAVRAIRALPSPVNRAAVSAEFGISKIQVGRVLNRSNWAHV